MAIRTKDYSDTYLYNKGKYESKIFEFIMHCDFIKNTDPIIQEIADDMKRLKVGALLIKVLKSPNTHICVSGMAMPRAFKSFVAKDVRGSSKTKKVLYIDLTGTITKEGNAYTYRRADLNIIASYLMAGLNAMIYYAEPGKIVNHSNLTDSGCRAFSSLIYYIVDYLRLSSDIKTKGRILYYSSKYYLLNILNKDMAASVDNEAMKIAKISEQEKNIVDMILEQVDDPYKDVTTLAKSISAITRSESFTLDVLVDKWMYHLGVGTQFGLELYPAFANMLIYAYMGAYLNHQKTIEKCVGQPMVEFVSTIIAIGGTLV